MSTATGEVKAGRAYVEILLNQTPLERGLKQAQRKIRAFGENLLVSGIDFRTLPIGTVFETDNVKLRLTQIGKECHSHCAIYHRVGTCIMPHEGVFAEVLTAGDIKPGDIMTVTLPVDREE